MFVIFFFNKQELAQILNETIKQRNVTGGWLMGPYLWTDSGYHPKQDLLEQKNQLTFEWKGSAF